MDQISTERLAQGQNAPPTQDITVGLPTRLGRVPTAEMKVPNMNYSLQDVLQERPFYKAQAESASRSIQAIVCC